MIQPGDEVSCIAVKKKSVNKQKEIRGIFMRWKKHYAIIEVNNAGRTEQWYGFPSTLAEIKAPPIPRNVELERLIHQSCPSPYSFLAALRDMINSQQTENETGIGPSDNTDQISKKRKITEMLQTH